jgi:hypothetical protein
MHKVSKFGTYRAEATKWKSEFGSSVRVRSYNLHEEPKEKLYAEVEEI